MTLFYIVVQKCWTGVLVKLKYRLLRDIADAIRSVAGQWNASHLRGFMRVWVARPQRRPLTACGWFLLVDGGPRRGQHCLIEETTCLGCTLGYWSVHGWNFLASTNGGILIIV